MWAEGGSGVMSMYHLSLKTISRGDGRNAVASASYRSGEKLTHELTGKEFDYSRKQNIDGGFILAPEGSPEWATNRSELWNRVEKKEVTKKDGLMKMKARLAYEVELSLQTELTPEQNMEMTKQFLQENFVDKGFVVDVNFHNLTENENPHAHCMITTREITADGFGKKIDRDTFQKREFLEKTIRPNWEEAINTTFEKNNVPERVSCKSFVKQGITDRRPKGYVSRADEKFLKHDIITDRMQRRMDNEEFNELSRQEKEVKTKMENLKSAKKEAEVTKTPAVPVSASQNASDKPKSTKKVSKPSGIPKVNMDPLEDLGADAKFSEQFKAIDSQETILSLHRGTLKRRIEHIDKTLKSEGFYKGAVDRLEKELADLNNSKSTKGIRGMFNPKEVQRKKELESQLIKARREHKEFTDSVPKLLEEKNALNHDISTIESDIRELQDKKRKFLNDNVPGKSKKKSKSRNKGFQKD